MMQVEYIPLEDAPEIWEDADARVIAQSLDGLRVIVLDAECALFIVRGDMLLARFELGEFSEVDGAQLAEDVDAYLREDA